MHRKNVTPLEGSLIKNMLIFSLPIMGMMILSMLFSSMDTMVIGRFGHENAVSAIGVSGAFINLISGGLVALSEGVTIVLSNLYGRHREAEIHDLVNILPLSGIIIGGTAGIMMFLLADPILKLLNCPAVILDDAKLYFRIYFLSMTVSLPYDFLAGALHAGGDSISPFKYELAAEVLNIGLNLFTVIILDWNLFGVAIATLVSQILAFFLIMRKFFMREDELQIDFHQMKAFRGMGEIMKLGIPSSAEGVIINLSGVVISSYINKFSPDLIAGNTIGQSIEGFVAVSFVGFSSASLVFISQNYGAGNLTRVRKCYLITVLSVTAVSELLGVLMYLVSPVLIGLFTDNPDIAVYARTRMFYMCMFYGFCGGMNVLSGCIRGLKDTVKPLVISIFCSVIVRLSWVIFYAGPSGDIRLIYAGFPVCWFLSTILSMVVFELDFYRIRKAEGASFQSS